MRRISKELGIAPATLYAKYFPALGVRAGMAGRRSHEPTGDSRQRVERLAREARTQPEIAAAIGVSEPTLRKHYAAQLAASDRRLRRLHT